MKDNQRTKHYIRRTYNISQPTLDKWMREDALLAKSQTEHNENRLKEIQKELSRIKEINEEMKLEMERISKTQELQREYLALFLSGEQGSVLERLIYYSVIIVILIILVYIVVHYYTSFSL